MSERRSMAGARHHAGQAGFSLTEVLVSLFILSLVTMAGLSLIDSGQRVTSSQTGIAELQNNQRVVHREISRMVVMAGLGGLPESIDPSLGGDEAQGVFPNGLALAVANSVPEDTRVGDATSPRVVEGSDILTVRGVFSLPVFLIEPQVPLSLDGDGRFSIEIRSSVDIGVSQDLENLRLEVAEAIDNDALRPEAFIVRDRYNPGAFAVLELEPNTTDPGDPGDPQLTLGLILSPDSTKQKYANEYGRMILGTTLLQGSGGDEAMLPDETEVQLPRVIGAIGLLEEYRFYVREEWEISGDEKTRPAPVLARTRFYPSTEDIHPDGTVDVAGDVIDFQVALGVDLPPGDGQIADGFDASGSAVDEGLDEIIFNHPNDDAGLSPPPGSRLWANPDATVSFARLTTVVQATRPDRNYSGDRLGVFEDHDLSESIYNEGDLLKVRKRSLQTVVELRNLP